MENNEYKEISNELESKDENIEQLQENNKQEEVVNLSEEKKHLQETLEGYKKTLDNLDADDESGQRELYLSLISILETKIAEIPAEEEVKESKELDEEDFELDSFLDDISKDILTEKQFSIAESEDIVDGSVIEDISKNIESEKIPNFEISDKTGLSKQGETINELKQSLQILEENPSEEISTSITEGRYTELQNLTQNLEASKGKKEILNTKIKEAIDRLGMDLTIEDFISKNEKLQEKVDIINADIEGNQSIVEAFDSETKQMIEDAQQEEINKIKENIKELESDYIGSEAEKYDNKIILDKKLQELLGNSKELFSEDNVADIYKIYGLEDGNSYIQKLLESNDQSKDEIMRDSITKKIFSYTSDYLYGDISQSSDNMNEAISNDIEDKLNELQELDPDSKTIKKALKLKGKDRLVYLIDSRDPKLKELVFWFSDHGYKNMSQDQILAEHPQYQKVLKDVAEEEFKQQQKKEFNQQQKKEDEEFINNIISKESKKYKDNDIDKISRQILEIKNSKEYTESTSQDELMMSDKKGIEKGQFNTYLSSALESSKEEYTFKDGNFSIERDFDKVKSLNSEMDTIISELSSQVKNNPFKEEADFENAINKIQQDLDAENKKFILFKDNKEINRLQELQNNINTKKQKYLELLKERDQEIQKWDKRVEFVKDLESKYNQLPKSIQKKLEVLSDTSKESMIKTIQEGISEIINYTPDSEFVSKKEQLTNLESKMAELKK